jgi:peroxiredoxin
MSEPSTNRASNVLAISLVIAVIFQIFLSVLVLRELRSLPEKLAAAGGGRKAMTGLAAGVAAPPFRLQDSQGNEVSLANFKGRKIMLVFSSTRCKYCTEMYPELQRFQASGQFPEMQIVLLQIASTPEVNRNLRTTHSLEFPVLAADEDVFRSYKVPGTPFSTIIDEKGVVMGGGVTGNYEQMASVVSSTIAT